MASWRPSLLGRTDLEWILLSLWISLLGVQLPVDIQNFRFSPADIVLAILMILLLVRRPREVFAAIVPRTPVQFAILALVVALAWGSAVSLVRTRILVQEALLNKDTGVLVLGSIVVACRVVARDRADVRRLLRTFLIAGTAITWIAAVFKLLLPLALNASFTERFDGFLLNPSANAVFLAVLLMVQIGFAVEQASLRLGVLNTAGLTLLLLLTLSRSTWLAVMIALVAVVVLVARRGRWLPAAVAAVLLIFTVQPLISVLGPVVSQVLAGTVGRFERQIAPKVTPSPDIGQLLGSSRPTTSPSGTPAPTSTAIAAGTGTTGTGTGAPGGTPPASATATPTTGPAPTPEPVVPPVSVAQQYVQDAQSAANDRFGATDRLAFNVVALKLWLGSKTTALAGIGLGVFLQVSPQLFGVGAIIHNSYLWLPVEMGVPGLIALIAILYAMLWTCWHLARLGIDTAVTIGIVGSLFMLLIWIGENEGLYQRTLWMVLALGAIAIRSRAFGQERLEG